MQKKVQNRLTSFWGCRTLYNLDEIIYNLSPFDLAHCARILPVLFSTRQRQNVNQRAMQATPTPTIHPFLDPGSWSGAFSVHVIGALVGGVLLVATLALVSGLFFPAKYWWGNRELRKLIRGRVEFILVYNPHATPEASKTIVFLPGGQIAPPASKNQNEDAWRARRGCLEFVTDDGKVYSRFRFNKTRGQLVCTNYADIRSLFSQYLFPQY